MGRFCHVQDFPHALLWSASVPTPSLCNSSIFYLRTFIFFKRLSYKWSHVACVPSSLASFTSHSNKFVFIHVIAYITHSVPGTGNAEMGKAQPLPSENSESVGGGTWAY